MFCLSKKFVSPYYLRAIIHTSFQANNLHKFSPAYKFVQDNKEKTYKNNSEIQKTGRTRIINLNEIKPKVKVGEENAGPLLSQSNSKEKTKVGGVANFSPNEKIPSQQFFETKDKQLSSEILRCLKREDLVSLFERKNNKKPIHYSLLLYQFTKITKDKQKSLKYVKPISQEAEIEKPIKLWMDDKFLAIVNKVIEKLDEMSPDSIIKVLQALSLKRSRNQLYFDLYIKILDLLSKENNALLFDKMQQIYLLLQLCKFSKIPDEAEKREKITKTLLNQIKTYIPNLDSKNLIRVCKSLAKTKRTLPKEVLQEINLNMLKRLSKHAGVEYVLLIWLNYICLPPEDKMLREEKIGKIIRRMMEKRIGDLNFDLKYFNNLLFVLAKTPNALNSQHMIGDIVNTKQLERIRSVFRADKKRFSLYNLRRLLFSAKTLGAEEIFAEFYKDMYLHSERLKPEDSLIFMSQVMDMKDPNKEWITGLSNKIYVHFKKISHDYIENCFELLAKDSTQSYLSEELAVKLLKRSISFLLVANHKLPERHQYRILYYLGKIWTTFKAADVREMFLKYLRRTVLENKYLTFEEMYAKKNVKTSDEEKSPMLITSYLNMKSNFKIKNPKLDEDSMDRSILLIIKKQTKIINSLWFFCCLMVNAEGKIRKSTIFQEFNDVFKTQIDFQYLSLENLERLWDLRNLMEFQNITELKEFFESEQIKNSLNQRIDILKKAFPERRKNIRTQLMSKIREHVSTLFLPNQIVVEAERIFPFDIMIDVVLENVVNKKKIGICFYSNNTDREDLTEIPSTVNESAELDIQRFVKNGILKDIEKFTAFYYIKQNQKDKIDLHVKNLCKLLV